MNHIVPLSWPGHNEITIRAVPSQISKLLTSER